MLRRFVDRVSSFDALSAGAVAAASVLLAFAVAGPVVELAGLPGRLIVFAVVMALQISRERRCSPRWAACTRVASAAMGLLR